METSFREFSGRRIYPADIALIKEVIKTYRKLSRRELTSTICEILEWATPNGQPKRTACASMLNKLENEGEIILPAIKDRAVTDIRKLSRCTCPNEDITWMDRGIVTECEKIELTMARPGDSLQRWRAYVRAFHMLGDVRTYGSRVYYIVTSAGRDIGCLQFSASAWALFDRDEWIGWTAEDKKARLHLILNNSRMLIFPWVRVRNLGSRVLSLAAKQVVRDFMDVYCYEPVMLETFVDTSFFHGTIYKAANWAYLGETKGRGRNDRYTEKPLAPKAIYAYPLRKDFRAILKGEKAWKAGDPDDMP